MVVVQFTMLDSLGMHEYLANLLAKYFKVAEEQSDITFLIGKGKQFVRLSKPTDVMKLGIRTGDEVAIVADGENEEEMYFHLLCVFIAFSQVRFHFSDDLQGEAVVEETCRLAESPENILSVFRMLSDERTLNGQEASALKKAVAEAVRAQGRSDEKKKAEQALLLYQAKYILAYFGRVIKKYKKAQLMTKLLSAMVAIEFRTECEDIVGYTIRNDRLVAVRKSDAERMENAVIITNQILDYNGVYNEYGSISSQAVKESQAAGSSRPASQPAAQSRPAAAERPKEQEEEGSLAGGFVLLGFALTLAAVGSFVVFTWFPGAQTVATIVLGLLITAGFAGLFAELDHVVPGIVAGLVVQAFLLHYIWSMGNRVILPTLLVGIALVVVPALLTSEK